MFDHSHERVDFVSVFAILQIIQVECIFEIN